MATTAAEDPFPVQESWPSMLCFGCGPANPDGLHLHSFLTPDRDALVANFTPDARWNAGVMDVTYGGLLASLLDCHSIWTAMTFANLQDGLGPRDAPRHVYVTGELAVRFMAPTPLGVPLALRAEPVGGVGKKVVVEAVLRPEGRDPTVRSRVTCIRLDGVSAEDQRTHGGTWG